MKPGLFTALAGACFAMGSPIARTNVRRSGPMSDLEVLQYASTLENLEAALYEQALAKFTATDFANAGFADWVRPRVSQIAEHESSHVQLLSGALGNNSVPPCQYAFPLEDPATFIGFATALENIGVSAYVGANQYISDPLYRTIAASILSVEARHQGFLNGPVLHRNDWTGPYETPLNLDMVYTLVAPLISSCPKGVPVLQISAQTPLTSDGSSVIESHAGETVQLDYAQSSSSIPGPIRAVLFSGLGAKMLDYDSGFVTLPQDLQGWSFIILTNAKDVLSVTTANTVAGPAEINIPFDAFKENTGFQTPYAATINGEASSAGTGSAGSGNTTTTPGQTASGQGASSGGNSTTPDSAGTGNTTTTPGEIPGGGTGGSSSSPICRANQCNTNSDCGRSNNPFSSRRCTQGTRVNGRQCGRVCTGI